MDVLSTIVKFGLSVNWLVETEGEDEITGVRVGPELDGRGLEATCPVHEDTEGARQIALTACIRECLRKNNLS